MMMRDGAKQLAEWRHKHQAAGELTVAVNLSTGEIDRPGLVSDVAAILRETGLPPGVLKLEVTAIRAAGLSARKVEYLCDLAAHFASGAVHVEQWQQMDDEAIIDELVAIRGIGRWTAEMFLIFSLGRPDVLPVGDLGLRSGVMEQYGLAAMPGKAELEALAEPWRPYRSIATWYIWRSKSGKPPGT